MARRALIVDDEDSIRFVLREALGAHGWEVVEAGDGSEVEPHLKAEHFDLILLDLYMPGMNGFEVLRRLRRRDRNLLPAWKTPPSVRVLVISAAPNREGLDFARRIGADACLPKPFDVDEVLALVRELGRTR
jgi:DNA-binding response OmpR family regulator